MQVTYELGRDYIGYDICHEFMEFNRKVKDEITGKGSQGLMFTPKNTIILREQSSEKVHHGSVQLFAVFDSFRPARS